MLKLVKALWYINIFYVFLHQFVLNFYSVIYYTRNYELKLICITYPLLYSCGFMIKDKVLKGNLVIQRKPLW